MEYKLICIDMDGTLLNDKKTINDENIEAIKKAIQKGVKVAVTTGRLFTSAKFYANLLGVKAPVISSNGAYIREKDKDEIIYKATLGLENSKKVLEILKKYDIKIFFNTCDSVIANREIDENNAYLQMNKTLPKDKQIKFKIVKDFDKIVEDEKDEILKCICIDEDFNKIKKVKREIQKINGIEVVSSNRDNFEVMKEGICKGKAVEILAGSYGIKQEEIICIGDSENDLSMIKYAGMGVAMKNGAEDIKVHANYITDTNNNSGVAKAIEKFVL